MLKTLLWLFVLLMVLRYLNIFFRELYAPRETTSRKQPDMRVQDKPFNTNTNSDSKEGEYIDYEEIK
jgi:hypothetical protein